MTDWDGSEYRQVNTLQQWLATRALTGLDLDGVQSLLDVGCGDGRITAAIAARIPGATVVGIDPSPGMIEVAPASGPLSFEVGEVGDMTFTDPFDLVVSFNALHWVLDQHRALTRISVAMRRPGRALLVFVCGSPRPSLELVAMEVTGGAAWRRWFVGFTAPFVHPDPATYPQIVEAAGLAIADLEVTDLDWDFGSRDAFRRWCTVGFGAWTSRLPDDLVDAFMTDVVAAYAAATGSDQIFRFLQMRAALVT